MKENRNPSLYEWVAGFTEERRMPVLLVFLYPLPFVVGFVAFSFYGSYNFMVFVFLILLTLIQTFLFYVCGRKHDGLPMALGVFFLAANLLPRGTMLHPLGWFFFSRIIIASVSREFFGISNSSPVWPMLYLGITALLNLAFWLGWCSTSKKAVSPCVKDTLDD